MGEHNKSSQMSRNMLENINRTKGYLRYRQMGEARDNVQRRKDDLRRKLKTEGGDTHDMAT